MLLLFQNRDNFRYLAVRKIYVTHVQKLLQLQQLSFLVKAIAIFAFEEFFHYFFNLGR
jgi:hypothetical protein